MDINANFFPSAVQVIPILHWVRRFVGKSNGFYKTNIVSLKNQTGPSSGLKQKCLCKVIFKYSHKNLSFTSDNF